MSWMASRFFVALAFRYEDELKLRKQMEEDMLRKKREALSLPPFCNPLDIEQDAEAQDKFRSFVSGKHGKARLKRKWGR